MSESMADAHSATPQPGSDEDAVVTTAVPSTSPADEKTDSRCGVNKIASLGRQLRSMKIEYLLSPSLPPPVRHSPCVHALVTTKADPPPPPTSSGEKTL
nr:unnamed protein product [Spirometra erinaceieuropaei]